MSVNVRGRRERETARACESFYPLPMPCPQYDTPSSQRGWRPPTGPAISPCCFITNTQRIRIYTRTRLSRNFLELGPAHSNPTTRGLGFACHCCARFSQGLLQTFVSQGALAKQLNADGNTQTNGKAMKSAEHLYKTFTEVRVRCLLLLSSLLFAGAGGGSGRRRGCCWCPCCCWGGGGSVIVVGPVDNVAAVTVLPLLLSSLDSLFLTSASGPGTFFWPQQHQHQ